MSSKIVRKQYAGYEIEERIEMMAENRVHGDGGGGNGPRVDAARDESVIDAGGELGHIADQTNQTLAAGSEKKKSLTTFLNARWWRQCQNEKNENTIQHSKTPAMPGPRGADGRYSGYSTNRTLDSPGTTTPSLNYWLPSTSSTAVDGDATEAFNPATMTSSSGAENRTRESAGGVSVMRTPAKSRRWSAKGFTPKINYRNIKNGTAEFFGLPAQQTDQEKEEALKALWQERRKRFSSKKYGGLKEQYAVPRREEGEDEVDFWRRTHSFHFSGKSEEATDGVETIDTLDASSAPKHVPKPRKESVAKLTMEGISFLAATMSKKRARLHSKSAGKPTPSKAGWSRSFAKSSIASPRVGVAAADVTVSPSSDSVFEYGESGEGEAVAMKQQFRRRPPEDTELAVLDEEPFFDRPETGFRGHFDSVDSYAPASRALRDKPTAGGWKRVPRLDQVEADEGDTWREDLTEDVGDYRGRYPVDPRAGPIGGYPYPHGRRGPQQRYGLRTPPPYAGVKNVGLRRVWDAALDRLFDNSNRRQFGMGVVGRLLGRSVKKSVVHSRHVKAQLDDMDDYRPYFTYWVTVVQILITFIAIFCYGFGPVGLTIVEQRGLVQVTSLVAQSVDYWEPANFWFGPRAADLIHLGAKFAPCMRHDAKIYAEIEKERLEEKDTACCIRNDNSGCAQASRKECSATLSTWTKWTKENPGPGGRTSGTVCGLDPSYCREPSSIAPYDWQDDITKWPICTRTTGIDQRRRGGAVLPFADEHGDGGAFPPTPFLVSGPSASDGPHLSESLALMVQDLRAAAHMVCEMIARPCCIGIHGHCRITTREYCDFVKGYFHDEAALCSQVSCLNDVCGMVPFYNPEAPDQFYRLWTSLFLHAGLLHLAITVVIQWYFMRDLEKMAGPLRIGMIYIMSGVGGNLASAIFIPYRADVGPAGAQFGLLSCLFVEVINAWPMLKHPYHALGKLCALTFGLFILGLLPWVDNYSHIFGVLFGFLLAYALLPFVTFGPYDSKRKLVLIWVCLAIAAGLFTVLVLLFYVVPVYECEVCKYLSCIPVITNFCADQNINFNKKPVWSV